MPGRNSIPTPQQDLADESFIQRHAEVIEQLEQACQRLRNENNCHLVEGQNEPIVKNFMDLLLAHAGNGEMVKALIVRAENIDLFFAGVELAIEEDEAFDFNFIAEDSKDFFLAKEIAETLNKSQESWKEKSDVVIEQAKKDISIRYQQEARDNFLEQVSNNINSDLNQVWVDAFLECAEHWKNEFPEEKNFAVEAEIFLKKIMISSDNIADMQKPHGAFTNFKKDMQKQIAKSVLFKFTYENELKKIEEQCLTQNPEQPLALKENLITLSAESINFSYAGNDKAAEEAFACCEKAVKLFSKNAKQKPNDSDFPKSDAYPALRQTKAEKIIDGITSAVRSLFPSRISSYLQKKGYSFFAGPSTKPETLVKDISSSVSALKTGG